MNDFIILILKFKMVSLKSKAQLSTKQILEEEKTL